MERPDPLPTMRAVVETIIPGPPHDPTPGAVEAGADRFIVDTLTAFGGDLLGAAVMVLDGYAAAAGGPFHTLGLDERSRVLKTISAAPNEDLRSLANVLYALTMAAYYGDATSAEGGRLIRRPIGWDQVGYPGPASGHELRGRP